MTISLCLPARTSLRENCPLPFFDFPGGGVYVARRDNTDGSSDFGLRVALDFPLSSQTSGTASSDPSDSGSGASSASVDGTWKVASGSQAGYRVEEVLFGQTHEAVGRTSSITGQLTLSGTTVNAGPFVVDMTSVSSDQDRRDRQFQGRIMNTATYPTATFKVSKPIQLASIPSDNATTTVDVPGELTLHGTTKSVTIKISARRNGGTTVPGPGRADGPRHRPGGPPGQRRGGDLRRNHARGDQPPGSGHGSTLPGARILDSGALHHQGREPDQRHARCAARQRSIRGRRRPGGASCPAGNGGGNRGRLAAAAGHG